MLILKNINITNKTPIDSDIIAEKCLRIHPSALLDGTIFVTINNPDNTYIEIGQNVIIENNAVIIIIDSFFHLEDGVKISSNSSIHCQNSSLKISQGSCIGFCSKVTVNSTELSVGNDCHVGDFTKIDASGRVVIKNNIIIGDHSLIQSGPGEIFFDDYVKIDSHNEIVATGNISVGAMSHFWNGVYVAAFDQPFKFTGRVTLAQKCIVAGRGKLEICDGTMIGGATYIVTESHNCEEPFSSIRNQHFTINGVFIDGESWISAKCTILDGVNIGYRTIIGAGTLVNKDVPSYKLAFGVPVKIISDRRDNYIKLLQGKIDLNLEKSSPDHFNNWLKNYSSHDLTSINDRIIENKDSFSSSSTRNVLSELANLQKKLL